MPKLRAKDRKKRPDSAALAKPKKVHIIHGGMSSAMLRQPLDGRTVLGKMYREQVAALEKHIGSTPTAPQARLVDQAARLALLGSIAWAELAENGVFLNGQPAPALETFIKASGQEREVLKLLGLEPHVKQVPSLQDYIEGQK